MGNTCYGWCSGKNIQGGTLFRRGKILILNGSTNDLMLNGKTDKKVCEIDLGAERRNFSIYKTVCMTTVYSERYCVILNK